jgi:hypothetical protein
LSSSLHLKLPLSSPWESSSFERAPWKGQEWVEKGLRWRQV